MDIINRFLVQARCLKDLSFGFETKDPNPFPYPNPWFNKIFYLQNPWIAEKTSIKTFPTLIFPVWRKSSFAASFYKRKKLLPKALKLTKSRLLTFWQINKNDMNRIVSRITTVIAQLLL